MLRSLLQAEKHNRPAARLAPVLRLLCERAVRRLQRVRRVQVRTCNSSAAVWVVRMHVQDTALLPAHILIRVLAASTCVIV
jgi:hypothetical protein